MPSGQEPKRKKVGRRPAHQNSYAFKHNKGSKKTQKILASPNKGLCEKCHEIIEWRKTYRKYKPLTQPRRCNMCHEKTVTLAYHVVCDPCAHSKKICAKCLKNDEDGLVGQELQAQEKSKEVEQLADLLATLPLRKQKTILREIDQKEYEERQARRRERGEASDEEEGDEEEEENGDLADEEEDAADEHQVDADDAEEADEAEDDDEEDDEEEEEEEEEEEQEVVSKKSKAIIPDVPSLSDEEQEDDAGVDEEEDDEEDDIPASTSAKRIIPDVPSLSDDEEDN